MDGPDAAGRDLQSTGHGEALVDGMHVPEHPDLVELEPERLGQRTVHRTPVVMQDRGVELGRVLLDRLAEAQSVDHQRVVAGAVEQLRGRDRVDPLGQTGQREQHRVADHPGVNTGGEQRRSTLLARRLQTVDCLRVESRRVHEPCDRVVHDVLPGAQDRAQVVDHRVHPADVGGRVAHTVRVQRQDRLHIPRGHQPDRRAAAQLTGVPTVLGLAGHQQPDQLQVGVVDDAAQRGHPDLAGRPLDHPVAHRRRPLS